MGRCIYYLKGKYEMKENGINIGGIYELIEKEEEDVYVYVRALQGDEVGFSVLDKAVKNPDFSDCGMFWVREKDFEMMFKYCGSIFTGRAHSFC